MTGPEPRFGTDGVRGVANQDLTPLVALKLGTAAGHVLRRSATRPHVVVGRDTRVSGDLLEAALTAGLASTGCDVTLLGVLPTPGVSHITVAAGAAAGVVISASHNPFCDNGIKFFGADGRKLGDADEDEIEALLPQWDRLPKPTGADLGHIRWSRDLVPGYVQSVKASARRPLAGLTLVLDCANGATSELAPALFADLGAAVHPIHCEPDGRNINENCGSTRPADLRKAVVDLRADAGLAFDGDGDRVIMVDELGQIVDGDRMMAICALGMKREGALPGDLVVATIMSNAGLEVALEEHGIRLARTDVGDRYVAEEMERSGAALGGEQSGHLLFPRLAPTGDGMLTGLQVLCEMLATGRPLSRVEPAMRSYPQILRNVRVRDREGWRDNADVCAAIERARGRLSKPEWLSVRASGTEPLVRVMAQDVDEAAVRDTVGELCTLIETHYGAG